MNRIEKAAELQNRRDEIAAEIRAKGGDKAPAQWLADRLAAWDAAVDALADLE